MRDNLHITDDSFVDEHDHYYEPLSGAPFSFAVTCGLLAGCVVGLIGVPFAVRWWFS
jgi:hypothetical protein